MTRGGHEKMVPLSLVIEQVAAYRYAFQEACRLANEAIRQRDEMYALALDAECAVLDMRGECSTYDDPCPLFFEKKCETCKERIDMAIGNFAKARRREGCVQ